MIGKTLCRWVLCALLLFLFHESVAQKLIDLQRQKAQTLERISTTSQLIEEGSKSQAQNTRKLDLLTAQIETRNDLIKNINQQIELYHPTRTGVRYPPHPIRPIRTTHPVSTRATRGPTPNLSL